jgi:hypothetical protein
MKYFTGIDVSLRFVSICVVDEAGAMQYEGRGQDPRRGASHRRQPSALQCRDNAGRS